MNGPFLPAAPNRRSDRPVWFVVLGFSAVLLVLIVASALNYSSIVVAQATLSIVPGYRTSFDGTEVGGALSPNGTVSVRVNLQVENPSPRVLHLRLFAYSGWIEDGPAAAGLNESRRFSDDRLVGSNGTRYFFRVFGKGMDVDAAPVPMVRNATYVFLFNMSRSGDPSRFDTVRNITEYARDKGGDPARIPWNHWVRVQLTIDGVPVASSPAAALYLLTIGRIEREEGINLAT